MQQTPLQEAENLLLLLEQELKNLNQQYESKQAERIISNHVWMGSVFEERILPKLKSLRERLVKIKTSYVGSFKTATQFDTTISHCDQINKELSEILYLYKIRANPLDIKMKMQYTMPQIMLNMNSLRNRFYIVKGNVTRGRQEEEDWLFKC